MNHSENSLSPGTNTKTTIDTKKVLKNLDSIESMEEITRIMVENLEKYQNLEISENKALVDLSYLRNIAHTIALRWMKQGSYKFNISKNK